ncbi:MAG: hypothetical protein KTR17_02900 [Cellvibrionaceae bacterium]|nr:hypothetical protein [Cellvibrionaceae bacterium]
MKFPLQPEKPILLYRSLATAIGLEESVLAATLSEVSTNLPTAYNNGFEWVNLEVTALREALPFWNDIDIQRLCNSLRDKGVLIIASAPFGNAAQFRFAFNPHVQFKTRLPQTQAQINPPPAEATTPASKNYISPNWQPDDMALAKLAQHNIPSTFAYEQVAEFVTYWRESRETARSWGAKFVQHVIYQWRHFETKRNRQEKSSQINRHWRPSVDAMEVMTLHMAIPQGFIEDAIPEFVLYWQERGEAKQTWNSQFIGHVRIQWNKYRASRESSTDPKPIPPNWQPTADVFDILQLANIDLAFAESLIAEFVVYWRDSNQLHTSWNTRFLQHAKRQWAHRLANQGDVQSTREMSLEQELTDRSWAT